MPASPAPPDRGAIATMPPAVNPAAATEPLLRATTVTFLGIVACQVGTAIASRTERSALRDVGLASNRLLLGGIAFELAFAAAVAWLPPLQAVFGTRPPRWDELLVIAPFPLVVWGADELRRALRRRAAGASPGDP